MRKLLHLLFCRRDMMKQKHKDRRGRTVRTFRCMGCSYSRPRADDETAHYVKS